MMETNNWNSILEKVGLPGALILLLIYGGYRVVNWLGTHVFLPLTNRHIEFLNNIEKSLENSERFSGSIAQANSDMNDNLHKISQLQENMETCLQKITLCQEKLTVCVQVIEEKMTHGE